MIEIALAGSANGRTIGLPHRPDAPLTLDYEHRARPEGDRQSARRLYRSRGELSSRRRPSASATRPSGCKPAFATIASWVGYDLDGRTDIKWTLLVPDPPAGEARGAERHPRPLPRPQGRARRRRRGATPLAPDHRQARSRDRRRRRADRRAGADRQRRLHAGARRPTSSPAADSYNLITTEPIVTLLRSADRGGARRRGKAGRRRARRALLRRPASACRTSTCASTPCRSTTPSAPSCTSRGRAT